MNLKTFYKALNKPLDVFYKVIYNIYSIAYNTLIRAYKSLYKLYGCCCILFPWPFTGCLYVFVYGDTLLSICLCSTNFIFPIIFPKDFLRFFVLVSWTFWQYSTTGGQIVFVLVIQIWLFVFVGRIQAYFYKFFLKFFIASKPSNINALQGFYIFIFKNYLKKCLTLFIYLI